LLLRSPRIGGFGIESLPQWQHGSFRRHMGTSPSRSLAYNISGNRCRLAHLVRSGVSSGTEGRNRKDLPTPVFALVKHRDRFYNASLLIARHLGKDW